MSTKPTVTRTPADIHPKVAAGGIVGAIVVIVLAVCSHFGWHPGNLAAGVNWNQIITLGAALVAGYLKAGN